MRCEGTNNIHQSPWIIITAGASCCCPRSYRAIVVTIFTKLQMQISVQFQLSNMSANTLTLYLLNTTEQIKDLRYFNSPTNFIPLPLMYKINEMYTD